MYLIINKTTQTKSKCEGGFPNLDSLLEKGDRIIIISFYSHTIKVPYLIEENGLKYWDWESFPFDNIVLDQYKG